MKKFHQFVLHIILTFWKHASYKGSDSFGNRYYETPKKNKFKSQRFVIYSKYDDPSCVTPDWFNWLHYSTDIHPQETSFKTFAWQKKPLPNLTGTLFAYKPKDSFKKTSYTPWKPNL